jgi:hypothetical protein
VNGDELREALARAMHGDWHPEEDWDAIPDSVRGYYRRLADAASPVVRAAVADELDEIADALALLPGADPSGVADSMMRSRAAELAAET